MGEGRAAEERGTGVGAVLLVEDSSGDASLVREQLAAVAPELCVTAVPTLAEARAALGRARFDCVLLDLTLPDGDGLDGLVALSSLDGPAVVVLTGHSSDGLALEALARGADDHLAKGSQPEVLARAVRYAVERRVGRQQLAQQEDRFSRAVESLRMGVIAYDRSGAVVQHNSAALRLLGYVPRSIDELRASTSPFCRIDGSPMPSEESPSRVAFETGRAVVGATLGVRLPDGGIRWLVVDAVPVGGQEGEGDDRAISVVSSFEDVTDRRRSHEALENLALWDPLTGLANRVLFLDRLEQSLQRATLHDRPVAVVLVDVDGFNSLNDSYGFAAGDRLLVELAARIGEAAPHATIGRLSADTFGVVLERVDDLDQGVAIARQLRDATSGRVQVGEADVYVGCSAGVALGDEGATPESLLRNADLALHRAKAGGGGRALAYEDGDLASLRERLELERDLRHAIAEGELTVAYQPIVQTSDISVVSAEALARWNHPRRGPIPADYFVGLAADLGLARELTRQMLEAACGQVAAWQADGVVGPAFRVAVNLAAADLVDRGLAGQVRDVLDRTGLDASCLALEVTETGLVQDTDAALVALQEVRRLGVHIAIDDFGTGYSSLSYLRRFPIDALKIDKSFVQGLGYDPEATTLARGIVSLARGLGLATIAEGIENSVQLEALRQLGCGRAQGYLWSEPLAPEQFPGRLRELAEAEPAGAPPGVPAGVTLSELGEFVGWAALDSLRTPVAVIDADGTILATNLSWQRFTLEHGGSSSERGVGANYLDAQGRVWGAEADEAVLADGGIRAVLSGQRDRFTLEYDAGGKEEGERFLLYVSPLIGRTGMAVVAHLDITDRHRAERELAESHQRFQSLVHQAPVGIVRLSPEGRILDTNPALSAIVGRGGDELYGMPAIALFAGAEPDDPWTLLSGASPAVVSSSARSRRRRFRRPDGELRVCEVTDVVVHDGDGRANSLVATVQDVTDQLRLGEELRRAQEMEALGRLAAGIAHEINTPTQFISDNLTFLAELWPGVESILVAAGELVAGGEANGGAGGPLGALAAAAGGIDLTFALDEVPVAIEQSQDGAERVATIVRAMKAFGHPDRSDPEPADLNRVVSNAVTVARNETKYVAELVLALGELPTVTCYPGAIGQAVLNLLVNAAHAVSQVERPEGGRGTITVTTSSSAGEARIEVADTGRGIPDEVLPHVFEPFFTTKPVGEGTGQGLALVWATIVERHHGRVEVATSPAGTSIRCVVPVTPPGAPARPEVPSPAAAAVDGRAGGDLREAAAR